MWISKNECLPTGEDADSGNCVLAWHILNGCMVTGCSRVASSEFITHWMRLPDGPEGYMQEKKKIADDAMRFNIQHFT